MIGVRTQVKLLRRLGIALIIFPEPITSVIGVAFMFVARHLSKRHEASVNSHLREIVGYYLAHAGSFGTYVDSESGAPGTVRHHSPSEEHPILGQITGSRSLGTNFAPSAGQNWYDIRHRAVHLTGDIQSPSPRYKASDNLPDSSTTTQKVTHHTINMDWLSRRYEAWDSAVARSCWATTCGTTEGVTHHCINMSLLSHQYGTGNVGQTKTKSPAVDIAQRRQRYQSAVNYRTVLSALQNNNYYYEMLSRGNAIGGY